jgi:hypothetical protein
VDARAARTERQRLKDELRELGAGPLREASPGHWVALHPVPASAAPGSAARTLAGNVSSSQGGDQA